MANTKRASAGGKKGASGGRKSPARGASNKKKDQETRRDILSLVYFAVATLTLFIAIIQADSYSPLHAIKQFCWGLFGYMTWAIPPACVWLGIIAMKTDDKQGSMLKYGMLVMLLCASVLSAVEAFCIQRIEANMQILSGYINFLSFSYGARTGGGLIGALLAWPVTKLLTKWGALILFLFLAMLALTGLRALSIKRLKSQVSEKWRNMRMAHPPKPKASKPERAPYAPPARGRSDNQAKLYVEQIENPLRAASGGVKPPKLTQNSSPRSVTSVKSPTDVFEIPTVNQAKSSKKRAAGEDKHAPVDLMRAVREQDDNRRNQDYIKNALGDHARKPKPVLTYEPSTAKSGITDDFFDPGFKSAPARPSAKPKREAEAPARDKKADAFDMDARAPRDKGIVAPPPRTQPDTRAAEKDKPAQKREIAQPKPSFSESAPSARPATKPKVPEGYMDAPEDEYCYPPIDLMDASESPRSDGGFESADMQRAETLIKTLQSFSIPVKLTGIAHGPAVTRFELMPAPGIKVSRIASLSDDLAMNLAAVAVRIEAPIPGKSAVGVEVPNSSVEIVHLRDVLESQEARRNASRLAVGLGKDNAGNFVVADLAKMPHVLIAGQTGSGKSVCINAIIISILYRSTPDEVRMILIDPKMVELNAYNRIPHLLVPVVTDPKKAASALDWAVGEMTRRYKAFAERGAKDIKSYNTKLTGDEKPMPQIVLIVDELADLMMTSPRDVEEAINRLAQLARAAGIHLVIATQRPSVDVITGLIKANIPSRIAFTVSSGVDSRTILDGYGAEKLLGRGDMLFLPPTRNKPLRVQGAWVSEDEVQSVVDYITGRQEAEYNEDVIEHMENAVLSDAEKEDKAKDDADGTDELFAAAVKFVVDAGQASISMLQRKLRVGYARAGRLIDEMASRGLVSQSEGSKSREVLISREQYRVMFESDTPPGL